MRWVSTAPRLLHRTSATEQFEIWPLSLPYLSVAADRSASS
jgi:hypothetical protein